MKNIVKVQEKAISKTTSDNKNTETSVNRKAGQNLDHSIQAEINADVDSQMFCSKKRSKNVTI